MIQGVPQSGRFPHAERMCKDLRSMQLFAEKVLAYRLGKPIEDFRSFGFHEPNTEEGRQVYTIIDDQAYYFLPKLTRPSIHRAFQHLQEVMRENMGLHPAVQQVVIVGDSSTVDDREHIQEALDNYQFTTTNQSASDDPSPAAPIEQPKDPNQVTLLLSATSEPLPIRKNLSYIDEDPYWDPRQDNLHSAADGILKDRAHDITTWIQQQPSTVRPVSHPPQPLTELQSPETELQESEPAPPVEQPAIVKAESQRQKSSLLGGIGSSLAFLLASIGILAATLLFMRGGLNSLLNPDEAANTVSPAPVPPPPPGTANPGASSQSFSTRSADIGGTTADTTAAAQSGTNSTPATASPGVSTASTQRRLPVPSFFVRTPSSFDGINFRIGPGVGNRKIRGIPDGYRLVDEGRQIGNWREVSFQGQRGWVYRPFIE